MTTHPMLASEEYLEQAFLFGSLRERLDSSQPVQDLLVQIREEILATTKLPMAIDFVLAELNHAGVMSSAMSRMPHYFNSFQTYLIQESERDVGRFNFQTALAILEKDAEGKGEDRSPQASFFFQFESLCRNSLRYDYGLEAMAKDPVYDESWHDWIKSMRKKIGVVSLADLVFIHSEYYAKYQTQKGKSTFEIAEPILFGEREGKVALANRNKDALFFFSALQRQLKYPPVPKATRELSAAEQIPQLARQIDRLEVRIKLLEDEQREQGIDLTKFYKKQ